MDDFGQYFQPVLMYITDEQESMIRLLFQQFKWTYKAEVLTVRQLEILRSLRKRGEDSDFVSFPVNQNTTACGEMRSNMECEEEESSVTMFNESALNKEENVPLNVDKTNNVVEKIDEMMTDFDKGSEEITADGRNIDKNHFLDHVIVKTEVTENYFETPDEDFQGLPKSSNVSTEENLCTSTVDSIIISDVMKQYSNDSQAVSDANKRTHSNKEMVSGAFSSSLDSEFLQNVSAKDGLKLLKDGTIEGLSNGPDGMSDGHNNSDGSSLENSDSASASLRSLTNSLHMGSEKETSSQNYVFSSLLQLNQLVKTPGTTETEIKKRKYSDHKKSTKKPENIYFDPLIEEFVNHLQNDKVARPIVTGLMLRSCCLFLLEKDQGYAEWCKNSVKEANESQTQTDWKSQILNIAYKSDQLLLEITLKRLKEIVAASMNRHFVDYLSKFLITSKNLTLGNKSIMKLTYKDVTDNLKKNLIEEPSIVCLSDEDLTYINTPDEKPKVSEEDNEDNSEKVACEYCKKKVQRKKMRCHISKNHPEHRNGHQCYTCKAIFPTFLELADHRKQTRHKVLFPEECPICGKTLSNDLALTEHLRNVHQKETSANCEICQKEFKGQIKVCKHTEYYIDSAPFPCDICGQTYPSKRYMLAHRKRHSDRKFKCEECGKAFITMSLLKTHERTHTGEKPFKCPYCDYRCACSNNLPKHIRTHQRKGK